MRTLLLFIILFIPILSHSQEVGDKKSRFPLFELSKGDDDTKNVNWGNFHFNNESFRKAADRYERVSAPSVEVQRNLGKSYVELDSVDKARVIFETIINAGDDVETEDYLILSQLQDQLGMYNKVTRTGKPPGRSKRGQGVTF